VSDLGTSDHLYNDHITASHLDPENFHFAAFLDSHSLHDGGLGFKPEVKNRSLSWQHSGSGGSGKATLKSKNSERKISKAGMKMDSSMNLSSAPGLLISSNSSSPFSESPLSHGGGGLDNLFNQPIKKKRTSKGAKFRMFTRVWVPAFKVAGCITQEKNGGWKYVQFDNGLPISSTMSANSVPSPRALSKGLVDGKWCRACDMEEFQEGVNGQHVPNTISESHFPSGQTFCGDDSDDEFDGNLLGIADSFGMISGNSLQFFSHNSNHSDLGSDDDFGNLPMSNSTIIPRDHHRLVPNGPHDTTSLLADDLDQLDSFLMKRRRDRSDSLDLMNANLNLNERDVFMTLGMNTKLEDSMTGNGKIAPTSIGGAGVLDDVAWHNIEYSGISLDDCDWNL
jgi:hypothetical protein